MDEPQKTEFRSTKWYDEGCLIGELDFIEEIGSGAQGTVFKANDAVRGEVAVKVFKRSKAWNDEQWSKFKLIYLNEARKLNICKHENIANVFYIKENDTDDEVYLVMELHPAGSIQEQHESGPIALPYVRRIATDLALGLQAVHDNNVLHRDIKPSNILIGSDGNYKITDFYLAANIDQITGFVPAPGYRRHWAPEIHASNLMDLRSEIWAASLTIYRLIHGNDIYQQTLGEDTRKSADCTEILQWLPHVPNEWRRLIKKGMAYNPQKRYQNAKELLTALNALPATLHWECIFTASEATWIRNTRTHIYQVKWFRQSPSSSWWTVTSTLKTSNVTRCSKKAESPKPVSETRAELEAYFAEEARKARPYI